MGNYLVKRLLYLNKRFAYGDKITYIVYTRLSGKITFRHIAQNIVDIFYIVVKIMLGFFKLMYKVAQFIVAEFEIHIRFVKVSPAHTVGQSFRRLNRLQYNTD